MNLVLMGKMSNGQTAPKSTLDTAVIRSLDEDIVKVLPNKKLVAVSEGSARIQITIGNITREVIVNVGETKPEAEKELMLLYATPERVVVTAGTSIPIILE